MATEYSPTARSRGARSGGPFVRRAIAATLGLVLVLAGNARAQDLPGPPANLEVIPAGSLVIPMDNTYQAVVAPFNKRAYGLVNNLLQNKIPVKWAIRAGKAKDEIDFSATASRIAPSAQAAALRDFKAGPFIVHKAFAALALARITAFGNNVAVYQLTQDVTVDVRYTLTFRPLVAINTANANIHTGILASAGISNYTVVPDFTIVANSCYTLATEPHNSDPGGVVAIKAFVNSGGNFMGQCASILTYENNTPGGYISTTGVAKDNVAGTFSYPNPDLSYSQFQGDLAEAGGSVRDFSLLAGSSLKPNAHVHADNLGETPAKWAAAATKTYLGGPGGMVFYLGGHEYGSGSIEAINGERMMLNAVLTPITRPAGCGFTFGLADVALTKSHSGTFLVGGTHSWTITATNVGTDTTYGATTVVDTLAAGITYLSASGSGWTFSATGQIVTATHAARIPAGVARAFTLTATISAAAVPGVTNRATATAAGDMNPSNDVASDPTTVIIPVDLTITKRHTAGFVDRSNGTYTLVVRNTGGFATQGATTVTDTLPTGLTYVSANGTGWSFGVAGQIVSATFAGAIATGDSATFTLTAAVGGAAVPSVTNSATVATLNDTSSAASNRVIDPTAVAGVIDAALAKRHAGNFSGTMPGVYSFAVRNAGSAATTSTITVIDTLPPGLTFSSAAGAGWTIIDSGGIVTATHPGPIAPGDSLAFTLTVTVAGAAVPGVTNAAVVSTSGDVEPANDRALDPTGVSGIPDIELRKRHSGVFGVGANGIYTLTVVNTSPGATVGAITVLDTLPSGLTYVSSSGAPWAISESGGIVTATHPGPIAANDSSSFTLTVAVGIAALGTATNYATASTPGDLFLANNRIGDPTVVASIPDLQLAKRHLGAFVVGQPGTFTLTLVNVSPGPTSGAITMTDTLPAGLFFVSGAGPGWTVSTAGNIVTATNPGPIAAGDSSAMTITVEGGLAAVPVALNAARVSTANDVIPANDGARDTVTVTFADLQIVKRHAAPFTDRQNGSYTVTVTNVGTAATFATITVLDTLPAGLSYVSGAGVGWGLVASGQVIAATHAGPLVAGDSLAFTLTVSVDSTAVPGVVNRAYAATPGDSLSANGTSADPTAVTGVVDLQITKRHGADFTDRSPGVWTIVVSNAGSAPTSGAATVTDTLPAGVTFVAGGGAAWSFAGSGPIVTATHAGAIAAGDSAQFSLSVAVGAAAVPAIVNRAHADTPGEADASDNSASDPTIAHGVIDLDIVKSHGSTFVVGANGTYLFAVHHTGSTATTGAITVNDTLPAGLSYVSGAGAGWSFVESGGIVAATHPGPLAPGDSLNLSLTVAVAAPALPSVTNLAVVTTAGDFEPANDRDVDVAPVSPSPVPDLDIRKQHVGTFADGTNGTYSLRIRNLGTAATTGAITVTDTLPVGLAFVSGTGAGWSIAESGGVVTATHAGPLAPGDSLTAMLTVAVSTLAVPSVTNTAWVTTALDANPGNNRDGDVATVGGAPDLALDKRHIVTFTDGAEDTWTIVVTNVGSSPTSGTITVTDTLPPGIALSSASGSGFGFSASGQVITGTHPGPLAAGDSLAFDVYVFPSSTAVPAVVNRALVQTAGDIDAGNDADTDSTTVLGLVDLALAKRHTAAFMDGGVGSYVLVVQNQGSAITAGAISVTDTLPPGLTFAGGSGSGWSFSNSGPIVSATYPGPLASGDSLVLSIDVMVGAAAVPGVINGAIVETAGDADPANDHATDPTAVAGVGGAPDLALDKRHLANFEIGSPGAWTLVVTNLGLGSTTGAIAVTDTLPVGITFVSGVGAGWTVTESSGILTATHPGPIAAGDSTSLTLTVNSSLAAFPGVMNAAVVATAGDLDAANDRDTDATLVLTVPDMALDKRHTLGFVDGANGTYTIVVANITSGPSLGAITVTDTLPAGTTFVSANGAGWNIIESGGIVTASYAAPIAPLDSTSFTVTVAVGATAVPGVVNAAELSGGGDTWPGNNRDVDPTAVAGIADLTLDKRHVGNFAHGQNGTWTLVVTNLASGATVGTITVTDTLPAGVAFKSGAGAGWSVAENGGIVTAVNAGPIAAGDSSAFTITALAGAAAVPAVVNAAQVSGGADIDPGNNRDVDTTAVVGVHDLTLDKRHTAAFVAGEPGTWTIVVTNVGTAATTAAISVLDTLPAGVTFASGSGAGWSITASGGIVTATNPGPIAAGDSSSLVLTVNVTPAAQPSVTNRAFASTPGDLDGANDSDSDSTTVGAGPDLALDKRHTGSFTVGRNGVYDFVVRNVGSGMTSGAITVTDTLPAGLTYVSGSGAGWAFASSGQIVTATYGAAIGAGSVVIASITVAVDPAAQPSVRNFATVRAAGDLNPNNDTDNDPTIVSGLVDFALDKRHVGPFIVGQNADWLFVVTNNGTAANTGNITVTDTLPASVTFVSALSTEWAITTNGSILTATNTGTITEGDSSSFGFTVLVLDSAVPSVTNQATVRTAGDAAPGNDTDLDVASVVGNDLALDKRHTDIFIVGGSAVYQFVVRNLGAAPSVAAITVTDSLPAGLTFLSGDGAGWSFAPTGQLVTATHEGPLAPGGALLMEMTVAIDAAAVPSVTNRAMVSTAGDVVPGNNSDDDLTIINAAPDLTIDKRHTGSFTLGQPGTYSFVVRNLGPGTSTGVITVIDSLPAGLTYASASGTGWSFASVGQVVTASHPGPLSAEPAQALTFTITVDVGAAAVPQVTNAALVVCAGDSDPNNNGDLDFTIVSGLPDLALDKRHTGSFTVDGTGTYTFVVSNSGSAPTVGAITVRDTLPVGLTYVSANGADWTFGVSGAVVTATYVKPLATLDSASFTLVVAVGAAALPSVTNSAVASTPGDLDGVNDRDADQTTVSGTGVLVVEKTAAPPQVEIGDVVDYAVTVRNIGNGPVSGVTVSDVLPQGLRYRGGSARMNSAPLADPTGAPGPQLAFTLGSVAPGGSAVLTYRVEVGAGAELGTGVNLAVATGGNPGGPVVSNTAAAPVQIRGGVFGDEGIIVGKIYVQTDCQPDRSQGPEELGIPGVRVYLEDGSFAITDVEGKYHFNHVRPRLHVVRIDSASLPAGALMLNTTQRHAGDGLSRLVDLVKGELHRADFTEGSNSPAVLAAVQQRRGHGEIADPADPGSGYGGAAGAEIGTRRTSLLVLGVIDAGIGRRSLTDAQLGGHRDGFTDALDDLSADSDDGRLFGRARGAVFASGPLTDSTSFTLRYDSQRDPQRRLFRDLRPFEGYDALGDASVHGWDAQSASRLYLRLDRGASFALLGDFTSPSTPARTLGAFTRSLNGGVAGLVTGTVEWNAWASEGHERQIIDELPGQGVSGPYALSRGDGTLGSETVEIVTRDRNQPTHIVRRATQLRNIDYTLEPFTGRLLFRRSVPSIDSDLNPVSIRVTYEAETGGDKFWVYGTDARWTPVTRLSLGAAVARDEDRLVPRSVVSANAMLELGGGITVAGEIARSDSGGTIGEGVKGGEAARLEIAVTDTSFNGRLYALRTGTGFDNPSAGVSPGREELGVAARVALVAHASMFVNALRTKDLGTQGHRDGAEAGLAYVIAERYTAEAAYRWARERDVPASPVTALVLPIEVSSVRGKLLAQLPGRWNTSVFGEVEQDIQVTDQHRFAFGGDTRLWGKTRAYARHENITSFAGPFALNSAQQRAATVIGLSSEALGDGQVFSEYRVRDAFAGREAHAAIGLRNRWTVARGVRLDGALERVTILEGASGEATAVAGGIEYARDPLWRGTGRLELRTQSGLQRWLTTAGVTRKLTRDWAALGRTTWLMVPPEERIDARSQVGVAYRQTDNNVWNGLARYENRLEKAGGLATYRKVANIVSAHANAQALPPLTLSGQLAAKWAHDDRNGLSGSTTSQLVAARALYDLGQRFDLGMTARGLRSGGKQFGLGAEIGFLTIKNLRLAAGYNVFGFRDQDLSGVDRTDHGPYLNFGYKFDESHFGQAPAGDGR